MLHYTSSENVESVLEHGLKTGLEPVAGAGLEWVLAFYDLNPVYLTTENSEFIRVYTDDVWSGSSCFEVDTDGLSLVADLPSLIDKGARYDEGMLFVGRRRELEPLVPFADGDGWIEIEHLLDPGSDAARVAILVTGTAACLQDLEPGRLALRPVVLGARAAASTP